MRFIVAATCVLLAGCGPLAKPMVDRLDDDRQAQVDETWEGMLTPSDRLERILLLDALLSAQLHQYGVDRLRFVSEKDVGDRLVVMEIRFDRAVPDADEFSLTYFDADGVELRRESYSRDEVNSRCEFLWRVQLETATEDMDPETRAAVEQRQAEWEERLREIHEVLAPLQDSEESPAEETTE